MNNTTTWNTPATDDFIQIAVHGVANDPPEFQSATVNGTTLAVTFDKNLDTGSTPAGSAFTVSGTASGTVNGTGTASLAAATAR